MEYDPSSRKNGRGAYLFRTPACLAQAVKNKGFHRALGSEPAAAVLEALQHELREKEVVEKFVE
jgi:predicted RNA-binding protein YlxR (DUF448 family)